MNDTEIKSRTVSQCISSDYCRGWNDAVKESNEIINRQKKTIEIADKMVESLKAEVKRLQKNEQIATAIIEESSAEIERLTTELVGMRGAANSYKMHYDKSQVENKELWGERNRIYESLQETKSDLEEYRKAYSKAKSEAISEFNARLYAYKTGIFIKGEELMIIPMSDYDEIFKEMVGDDNA